MCDFPEPVCQASSGLLPDEAADLGITWPGGRFKDAPESNELVLGKALAEGGEKAGQTTGGRATPRRRNGRRM
jgi:hypothetical protein